MKNKFFLFSALLASCTLLVVACKEDVESDSVVRATSVPSVYQFFLEENYIYGQGATSLYSDLPNIVAVLVDTVVGFEGGHGGKTGMDTLNILKSDLVFGDTVAPGGTSFSFQKFNKSGFRATGSANLVIASANTNPGPTALEGEYDRIVGGMPTGYTFVLSKVTNGIYLLLNPGGAATVDPNPTLLYNYKSSVGTDSLSFANQPDLCGGGTQLVAPGAPAALSSKEYSEKYPPQITSLSPITLKWVVYSFPGTDEDEIQGPVCKWGPSTRVFVHR